MPPQGGGSQKIKYILILIDSFPFIYYRVKHETLLIVNG